MLTALEKDMSMARVVSEADVLQRELVACTTLKNKAHEVADETRMRLDDAREAKHALKESLIQILTLSEEDATGVLLSSSPEARGMNVRK